METKYKIVFVGGDTNLRAAVTQKFLGEGWRIEPAESYDEIDSSTLGDAVIVLFVEAPGEVARIQAKMAEQNCWLPLIACASKEDSQLVSDAILSGAQGYLTWPFSTKDFKALLSQAEEQMESYVQRQRSTAAARARIDALSGRERDVLAALVQHGSNKRIAAELELSPRTVEIYRSRIMQRLGVDHIAQVIWIAFQSGYFAVDESSSLQ